MMRFGRGRRSLRLLTRCCAGALLLVALALLVIPRVTGVAATTGAAPLRMSDTPFSSTSVILIIIALAVDSIAGVVFSVTSATVRQSATPDHLMGPVMALNYTLCGAMLAVGTFGGGFLGSKVGPSVAIVVGCVVYVIAGLSAVGKPLGSVQMYRQPFIDTFSRTFGGTHTALGSAPAGERLDLFRGTRRSLPTAQPFAVGTVSCTRSGCRTEPVTSCAYVDGAGRACVTSWCAEHASGYQGAVVCQRHERVLTGIGLSLAAHDTLPSTDNWAASLALWVAGEIDPALMATLIARFPEDTGFYVRRLRTESTDEARGRRWTAPWAVSYKGSTVVTVAIAVSEENDKLLIATVNGREIAREVPPWISGRRDAAAQSRLDAANRARFFERLLERIVAGLP